MEKRRVVLLVVLLLGGGCSTRGGQVAKLDLPLEDNRDVVDDVRAGEAGLEFRTQELDAVSPADLSEDQEILEQPCAPGRSKAGCLCLANGDCASGWCMFHLGEKMCTDICIEECPTDWSCEPAPGPDPMHICMSLYPSLCLPCSASSDCPGTGARCVAYDGGSGSFCGSTCEQAPEKPSQACAPGYECAESQTAEGDETWQCVRTEAECECSQYAAAEQMGTECSVTNDFGTCVSWRDCKQDGLSECDAAVPEEEACDGQDNDCDGETDEGPLCDVASQCMVGKCKDAKCTTEPAKDGTQCFDEDLCTTKEHCKDAECVGDAVVCEADGNPCADQVCESQIGCKAVPVEGLCEDDGNSCTKDLCQEGECAHLHNPDGTNCEDDGEQCTADLCQNGHCEHPPISDATQCDDGDLCTEGDSCVGGKCLSGHHKPGCDDGGCGNSECSFGETPGGCPADCGWCGDSICGNHENGPGGGTCPKDCLAACGDGKCEGGEGVEFCLVDCGGCGDGFCGLNESPGNCAGDCPPACGNDTCEAGEGPQLCPVDCLPPCGNGLCEFGENPYSCPVDCTICGDAVCGKGEDVDSCPMDCAVACGNGLCEGGEGPQLCPVDCGWCGDGVCGFAEDATKCPADCWVGCGDEGCQAFLGETEETCPVDCVEDSDGDGVLDDIDNCKFVMNLLQGDLDGDGEGDACDLDDDNDGDLDATDCAPDNGDISHLSEESCDGEDNDCDGEVDEELGNTTCGKGQCEHTVDNCVAGKPQICDPFEGALQESCDGKDNDCNGAVDDGLGTSACGKGECEHFVDNCMAGKPQECNPFLGVSDEVCDGKDNNCDEVIDDNLGSVICGTGVCVNTVPACVMGEPQECQPLDANASEICDGLDNDCDTQVDEDLGTTTCGLGPCEHAVDNCHDAKEQICDEFLGAVDEVCDGIDNDCDSIADEDLGTIMCGLSQCKHSVQACVAGKPQQCDPFQGAVEEVCDKVDNDCDGSVDEELGATTCGLGECDHAQPNCVAGKLEQCDPFLGAVDEICDGKDNDCDGQVDGGFGTTTCGLGVCEHTVENCVAGVPQDCDPMEGAKDEICDGIDNDCDGETDDTNDPETETCGQGVCLNTVDKCVDGKPNECVPLDVKADEVCDGFDNDCDGEIDEELGTMACGKGVCNHTEANCVNGTPQVCDPMLGFVEEKCDGQDNDCDGVVDNGCVQGTSCKDVHTKYPDNPSGSYKIDPDGGNSGNAFEVHCDMERDGGGWMRVADVDASKGACPALWVYTNLPKTCFRLTPNPGCKSAQFETFGVSYSEVTGYVAAYQFNKMEAFKPGVGAAIDDTYVDGVSITHSSNPRKHIWTYAVGLSQDGDYFGSNCPCAKFPGPVPPGFVGSDYYCESGNSGPDEANWYVADTLFDGEGCPVGNTCCDPAELPWFSRQLGEPTAESLEARLCGSAKSDTGDIGVHRMELFVR